MKIKSLVLLLAITLLLCPLLFGETPASSFSIVRSTGSGIDIHFELPNWALENSITYADKQRISISDTPFLFIDEKETLPVFSTTLAIPYSGGVSLGNLSGSAQTNDGISLDFDAELNREREAGRYSESLYPAQNIRISEPQILRDFRVVSINLYPFQYDQQTRQLIVRQSMDVHISFDRSASVNEIEPPASYSSAFEKIYRGMILNYDEVINRETTYTSPRMLVIYGNYADTTFNTKVNEYVAWKRQRGFIVNAVNTVATGSTYAAIKAYIQTQYNNTSTRPDYIVLIGDVSGNIAIPTYGGYIDYYYTWLAGSDNLGDVIIGRISVETSEQMVNYMAKIVSLEQNLNIDTASWLDRMVLVGDSASSGISTIYTNRYIHDHSHAVNPDYTYTEIYGSSPSGTSINTAINTGVAFYNYRGYYGMSGWPSYISSLNNSYKLFHAVIITCGTGSFDGTATTETLVRHGTSSTLGGSVTAIGMATTSTHTPMNNCLDVGIFHGVYPLEMRDMGSAMLYGKLYLNAIYGVSNASQAYNFAGFCNLIGDPTASVYLSVPTTFAVTAPASIPAGATNMEITVKSHFGELVEGASVTLTNAAGLQVLGFTGSDGRVLLNFASSTTGTLTLTVDKDDFKPYVTSISVASAGGIVYYGLFPDDDEGGQSIGNGDGMVNNGETIELYVDLKNTTTITQFLSADVTTSDPYVTLLDFDRIDYNDITANNVGTNVNPIVFEVAANCPDLHQITLTLSVESTSGTFTVTVPVEVNSGKLDLQSHTFVGAAGNIIYPGNQVPMTFTLTNNSAIDFTGISARLSSDDQFFSVQDSLGFFGNINHGATSTNTANPFAVYARGSCIEGMIVPLTLYLYDGDVFAQRIEYSITIGQPGANDPLGQDDYGYFIFDNTDTGYDQCPTYSWVGIAPAEGGSGTALSLSDPGYSGDEGDQVGAVAIQTVNLPFSFSFYGLNYSQVSISSNGFFAFGATQDADWRNWRMPDAGGPSPMVAVFWDDLDLVSGTSNVYTYYNSAQHFYIVEWYHMVSGYNGTTQQTFQAILYDPVFFPTHTGDGQIKLQYHTIANIDLGDGDQYPHGNYSTVGIEDHAELDGLEYTFNNSYPTQAAPLANGRALLITTRPMLSDTAYMAIDLINVLDANANALLEAGETANLSIVLGNRGLVEATGVAATLSSSDPYVTINSNYSLYGNIASLGNAAPQTNYAITVSGSCPAEHDLSFNLAITSASSSWDYDFTLAIHAPELSFSDQTMYDIIGNHDGVLDPGETADVYIRINNTGDVSSIPGSATLTSPTNGITVNTSNVSFGSLSPASYGVLSFSISASSSIANGTQIQLNFSATAGMAATSYTGHIEIGVPITVDIGTGTSVNSGIQNSPITICNNNVHGQSVYTAAELNAAGINGPVSITGLGFYVVTAPNVPLTNYMIRMKHTAATNATAWHTAEDLVTTYSTASYMPIAGGYDLILFTTPFQWNGTDNILIDTAFSLIPTASNSGYLQYTPTATPTGYRFAWSNSVDQTEVYTGGNIVPRRYNIRLAYQPSFSGALISTNPTTLPFGNVSLGSESIQQFTVSNTGDIALTGTINTPAGYSVALSTRDIADDYQETWTSHADRTILSISVNPGQAKTYNLSFAPTSVATYNGNVVISTNAANNPNLNLTVSGAGILTALDEPVANVTGSPGNIQISWQAVPYAQQYKIYSASSPFGTYQVLTTTSNLSYTDTRVLDKVFYYVKAVRN